MCFGALSPQCMVWRVCHTPNHNEMQAYNHIQPNFTVVLGELSAKFLMALELMKSSYYEMMSS